MKDTYTIGEVSRLSGLPVSTLRYYDRQGLLLRLERQGNIRKFHEADLETLRVIECLKASGLEIKDIKAFMELCSQGDDSLKERRELFESRRKVLEQTIAQLQQQLDMIRFKCWYYGQAEKAGSEAAVQAMIPGSLPDEIRSVYVRGHQPKKKA